MRQIERLRAADSLGSMAALLGYKPKTLAYVLYGIPKASKYRQFELPKKSGGTRVISAPVPELKQLQTRLARLLQSCQTEIEHERGVTSSIAHGFKSGYSIVTNASTHRGRRYVFNLDLHDFFGSLNFGRVRGFFLSNKDFLLPESTATILAQIASHDNALPQGSPCSPIISNLLGHILDVHLAKLAYQAGATYTRYVDDLTFSTNKSTFPALIAVCEPGAHAWLPGNRLLEIIARSGFKINPVKTRMFYASSRQEVTGLVVNARINPRIRYREHVRAMMHRLFGTGSFQVPSVSSDAAGKKTTLALEGTEAQLTGYASFIDYVRHPDLTEHVPLKRAQDRNELWFGRLQFFTNFFRLSAPVILCEGKTDNIYLRAALYALANEFPSLVDQSTAGRPKLKLRLYRYTRLGHKLLGLGGGNGDLGQFIRGYEARSKAYFAKGAEHPVIVLLDNDSGAKQIQGLIKDATVGGTGLDRLSPFHHVRRNLYVILTPMVKGGPDSFIEQCFPPALLGEKLSGKSLHTAKIGFDATQHYGKAYFAEHVVWPKWTSIDFAGFKPVIERILQVIEAHGKALSPK